MNKKRSLALYLILLILACEAIDASAQILMKKGLPVLRPDAISLPVLTEFIRNSASNHILWMGILVYASNFFIWIFILAQLELSTAVPLTSINYVILPVLTLLFLHEKISLLRWAGISLVVLGIYLVSRTIGQKTGASART